MPKSEDPKIALKKETIKEINLFKINNDFKTQEQAILALLDFAKEKGFKRKT